MFKAKKLVSLLAAATMAVTALTGAMTVSAADSGTCGSGVTWTFDSSTGKLTISGSGAMVSPPSSTSKTEDYADTYTYKKYKDEITEVEIGEGITSIGFCAFYQFPKLETVTIPSTIEKFSEFLGGGSTISQGSSYTFAECPKLKSLTLKEGIKHLGGYAFYQCTALESVRIPTTIELWSRYSFRGCSSLKDIDLPEGLK